MYGVVLRRGLSNCASAYSFPVRKLEHLIFFSVKRPGLRSVLQQQKKCFSSSRTRFSREGKIETTDSVPKPKAKSVPKLSELKKLLQVAHPERFKIAGNW